MVEAIGDVEQGVLILDEMGFLGTAGRIENFQIGVFWLTPRRTAGR